MSSRRLPTREHPPTHAGSALPSGSDDTSGSRDPGRVESPPTWTCASEAVDVCLFPPNRRRIGVIALLVGSLLVAINQGGALASGHVGWVVWVRVALDYLIPACVSTLGVLAGSRRNGAGSQRGAP
ncbi:MAG: nitrate/nitrite transporter NrtS [Actinomycetota bacterium]|nr:nitrate/nitrite transporter NrtS [Actinomycetota bacterium]